MQSFVYALFRLRWLAVTENREVSFTNNEQRIALVKLKPAFELFVPGRPQMSHLSSGSPCGFRHLDSVFGHLLFLVSSMRRSGILFLTAHPMAFETLRSMKADRAWQSL